LRVFVQAEDGIRGFHVTGVQTCALPISGNFGLKPTFNRIYRVSYGYWLECRASCPGAAHFAGICCIEEVVHFSHFPSRWLFLKRSEERRVGKEGSRRRWRAAARRTQRRP